MNARAQRPGALPMDDPHAANSCSEAFAEVVWQKIADLAGPKGVKI